MATTKPTRSPRRAQLNSTSARTRGRSMKYPAVRLAVYETLFALNRDIDQVVAHLARLQELGMLQKQHFGDIFPAIIQETRAWANLELVEALQPLEQDDWTHFHRLHIGVIDEAERRQKKKRKAAGKKGQRKRRGAKSEGV
jgi:hypothetical protein